LSLEKVISVAVLVIVYILIISDVVHRSIAALLGAVIVVGLGILPQSEVIDFIHWEALGLIFGMFILVAALKESGFFRWVGLHAIRAAKYDVLKIFIIFNLLTALLAAFIDSITVVIFMASLSIEVCKLLRFKPIPFLISLFASANIGGAATMVGDPPNVILGSALNFSFMDFVMNTGPIAVIVLGFNILFFYMWYRKLFADKLSDEECEELAKDHELDPFTAIKDIKLMRISLVIFAFTVTLFVAHQLLDIVVAFAAILGATVLLVVGGKRMPDMVEKIDWLTLVFLGSLFIVVGGMEHSGVLTDMANSLVGISGGNPFIIVTVLLWMAAIASSFLDNIPFVAAIVPVIRDISASGSVGLPTLTWTSALGADVGGISTPVASSANVVGLAVAEKHGVHISWKEFMKVAFPAMILLMLIINVLLIVFFLL
jgi:Na+/H+ antiporter NhaD/arsenite permease-like protein